MITVFASSPLIFIYLYLVSAPYGKHSRKGWGPGINPRIAWMVMETPAVCVIALFFALSERRMNLVSIIFLLIWEFHYVQRTYVYPFLIRSNKRFPVVLIVFAIVFNSCNGYINGRYLFQFSRVYSVSWFRDPRFILGVIFFIAGFFINRQADHILRKLRKPGEDGYKIPYGGFFKYVSNPNYFGEILEWTGWAIATWSLPGLAFAVFTIANLMPRAHSHHQWYLQNFSGYPAERKILIPFLY
ncbi:MAG: DUF1295 domain-containing protein [Spirochaetales bacterium]|nr:MAG: DUF1295 domain-containing protein [Spirochaetales bacterium]